MRAFLLAAALSLSISAFAQRSEVLLDKGWKFHWGDAPEAFAPAYDDSAWQDVCVPHDWAIYGPFSREYDLQNVAVTQNYEKKATLKTGRTGGLPYVGCGWYRRSFEVPAGRRAVLLFDGAMSEAHVWVNGRELCYWPYGYNSFYVDVSDAVRPGSNSLAVRLENLPNSSRWYPGAGLYRNVHLILTDAVRVPVWGTYITTPHVEAEYATVRLETTVEGADNLQFAIVTDILGPEGEVVASASSPATSAGPVVQEFSVDNPSLWSPESPSLYKAVSVVCAGGLELDRYETVFGIRSVEFVPHKGFFLNGEMRKFQGVCNHHDLGPLGAAVNEAALRHQLELLKDMGCDAIRTSHNMPAPELVRLCDEMGFMMMVEPFDEWDVAKCRNGYHRLFEEWAEKDMVNMLRQYRNHPSVVLWSIGNEVPTQCRPEGYKVATFLRDICHREDPSRLVTCGMDQVSCILSNGFAEAVDVPGINYRTFRYEEAYNALPQGFILGSETGSTVSSRGVYKLPAVKRFSAKDADHQCSAYELDACSWSNIPDVDLALAEDYPWTLGQFVWTGFDYLGEPSPYDTDAWPNHSSMFGIIDLASIPKDRFYLFRSVWNRESPTLHILPHWNWNEGDKVPVHVFTSYDEAELFLNGISLGRRCKLPAPGIGDAACTHGGQDEPLEGRYRLIWEDVDYVPGELKAVAFADGRAVDSVFVRTAGKPHHIVLETGSVALAADGKDLAYVTVSVVDKHGNLCPVDSSLLSFRVRGAGRFLAAANGDPTCLDPFHEPCMHAFSGRLTVILQSGEKPGRIRLSVRGAQPSVGGKRLRSATLRVKVSPVSQKQGHLERK
ncbi:MAG: DUF4982 domain-containing protein [Bacteroidales bacterium]|nr:DUF4982 domain-containing protein [Bacteroidales bacterium]